MTTAIALLAAAVSTASAAAVLRAANDNAGASWIAADTRADAYTDRHISTYVRAHVAVFHAAAASVDCDYWRFEATSFDGRRSVRLAPRSIRCRASERQERVLRAYLRAVGVDCC